tara:strand:- start:40 stop:300 length:261 start_codon:yes stop_codon:yes gene_type:complete
MKVGDLVQYRGWQGRSYTKCAPPYGLVVEQVSPDSDYHHRIRVMWIGETIPIQAAALSTNASRITAWTSPKHFEVVEDSNESKDRD